MNKVKFPFLIILVIFLSSCVFSQEDESSKIPTLTAIVESPEMAISTSIDPTKDWINEEIEFGKERVFIIVYALDKYFLDHSKYPETLEALVPQYLKEIPKTITGDSYYYNPNNLDRYLVGFRLTRVIRENSVFSCGYLLRQDEWDCGIGPKQ